MKKNVRVAYCTGFWCTNIGNAFFSMGVEYVLKKILGEDNVTIVSDLQTYTNFYGKRNYVHKNQYTYIDKLDVDYVVLAGPVLSKYFLKLWKDTIINLKKRKIKYILLSAGVMKLDEKSKQDIIDFFKANPPYIFCSRDDYTYTMFNEYAENSYNGICFSMFANDYYKPSKVIGKKYITLNFDKMVEPKIIKCNYDSQIKEKEKTFLLDNERFFYDSSNLLNKFTTKTDRFTDALIYAVSFLPSKNRNKSVGKYEVIRTDHRFHPHYRTKIYNKPNSFCSDIPYGYLNIYANTEITISDRVHACAVTMVFGNYAMLLSKTNRSGLLERVGAKSVYNEPTKLDLEKLTEEKEKMINWLSNKLNGEKLNESIN